MEDDYKRRLENIYRSHYPRYIRYAEKTLYAYTGNTDQAEDFVHRAFLLALEKSDHNNCNPEAWIMVTIRNICMSHMKEYRIRQPILKTYSDQQPKEAPSSSASSDILITLQQELSVPDYKLLYDLTVNGKTVEEISRETGLTPNYIHVRLFRIRKIAEKIIFSLVVIFTLSREI